MSQHGVIMSQMSQQLIPMSQRLHGMSQQLCVCDKLAMIDVESAYESYESEVCYFESSC